MTAADWHIVRSGHPQLIGDQRHITGDPFQFLPLFRTHREAESFCRTSGLWHQGIRPRQNSLTAVHNPGPKAGLSLLVRQAITDGVNVIGVFVGFDTHYQSCWEYYRVSSRTLDGMPILEPLPEDERPVEGASPWVVEEVLSRTISCGFSSSGGSKHGCTFR